MLPLAEEIAPGAIANMNRTAAQLREIQEFMEEQAEKKRGYNQSELMARRLGTRMNVAVDSKSLIRKMNTKLLRTMSPAEREIALKGAFGISPKANVKRKRILLIDDIYTTGATADACSKVLKDAGALEVVVLSLASGGNRKPEEN
jgi:ComF family protein